MGKFRKLALLLVVLACVGVNNIATAQSYYEEDKTTFYGGVSLGGTFSQVDGDNFAGYHKMGISGGAIVYAQLARHIAPSLEILYTQKGARSNTEKNAISVRVTDYRADLNYVEVPVLFNYFDKRKSHFGLGASYSQLVSGSEKAVTQPALPATFKTEDYPFNKYDINGIASVNLYLKGGFFLNVRFQYSVVPIRTNYYPDLGRVGAKGQSNNFWALRLMYIFE